MTTGYKINGAKDNAANYSIATNMGVKLSSYQVAEDNCAMGLDLITTASESLDLINDKLVRLRALAEQSANGTYGEQSLKAINAEANALVDEISRNIKNTEYNGIKIFGEQTLFLQKVNKRDTSTMTSVASLTSGATITNGTYSISTAEELAKLNDLNIQGGEFVLADDIDLKGYSSGEGWQPIENFKGSFDGNGYVISNLTINRTQNTPGYLNLGLFKTVYNDVKNLGLENVQINGSSGYDYVGALCGDTDYDISITNCYANGNINTDGDFAGGLVGQCYGNVTYSHFEGNVSSVNCAGGIMGDEDGTGTCSNCFADVTTNGNCTGELIGGVNQKSDITLESNEINIINLQVGIDSSEHSSIKVNTAFSINNLFSCRKIGIGNNGSLLSTIDEIINKVNTKQTEYGAAQNRLESALDEISTQYENLTSSRSTLRDADIAEVSSEYIRQQILQQASATLLSTANQTPALALQLL